MISNSLFKACLGELLGTYLLVLLGLGVVHAAVLADAQVGLWQVAVVWGVAVMLAVYAVVGISGAHINPAITLAFAVFHGFTWRRVVPYVLAQTLGAFLAAATLYAAFGGVLSAYEQREGIVRGQAGSERSASVYCMYYPNPIAAKRLNWSPEVVSWPRAAAVEAVATALLTLFVFVLWDKHSSWSPGSRYAPAFVGLMIAALVSTVAPLTMAGFNPARDLGPRLWAWCAGWGPIALPGPRPGVVMVYWLAPIVGALVGAGGYRWLIRPITGQADRHEAG